jgi:integrase
LLRTSAQPRRRVGGQAVSKYFKLARDAVAPYTGPGKPPSFHEIRSLSERLYRAQGMDTQTLLGHRCRRMTDKYNDD